MTVPSSAQKTILRKKNRFTKKYISILNPKQIACVLVNVFPTDQNKVYEIEYDSVVSGDIADVLQDMTCWVGTEEGKYDLGMLRIRKAPDLTKFYVNEHSDIKWETFSSDIYLTVVDDFGVWAKHPRLLADGSHFMDWDIAYSNQHSAFKPYVNMGTHAVAWLESGTVDVSFDASNSFCFSAGSKTYLWECDGGTIDNDAIANPVITFTTEGTYRVSCKVTVGGVTGIGYRYVFVYSEENPPYFDLAIGENGKFLLSNISGNFDEGGWSFDVTIYSPYASEQKIRPNALVVVSSKDYYDNSEEAIGSESGRENIEVVGYISEEDFFFSNQSGYAKFKVKSPYAIMKNTQAFTDGIENVSGTPAAWTSINGMTIDKAVWHMLTWRSTCSNCFDWYPTNDTRQNKEALTGEGKLWEQIASNVESILAKGCFNKYGCFYTEVERQLVSVANRSSFLHLDIEVQDYQEGISTKDFQHSPQYSMVELMGMYYKQGDSPLAFFALSPGNVYKRQGDVITIDSISLPNSQDQVNEIAGLLLGWYNHRFEFDVKLKHKNRLIDLCPRQYISLNISSDSPRNQFSGNIVPRSIRLEENPETGFEYYAINGENETFPENAIKMEIPESPYGSELDLSIPTFPDFTFPPTPLFLFPSPSVENLNPPPIVAVNILNKGIFYTDNFDAAIPNWKSMNTGLSEEEFSTIIKFDITPSGRIYCMNTNHSLYGSTNYEKIHSCKGLGGIWSKVFDISNYGSDPKNSVCGFSVHPFKENEIAIWGGRLWSWPEDGNIGEFRLSVGNESGISIKSNVIEYPRGCYCTLIYTEGKWSIFTTQGTFILGSFMTPYLLTVRESNGFVISNLEVGGVGGNANRYGISFGSSKKFFAWDNTTGYVNVEDAETTQSRITDEPVFSDSIQAMSMSPTGQKGLYCHQDGINIYAYKTVDSGENWEEVNSEYKFLVIENCGDENRFLSGALNLILFSSDLGQTWTDKTGDLYDVIGENFYPKQIKFIA